MEQLVLTSLILLLQLHNITGFPLHKGRQLLHYCLLLINLLLQNLNSFLLFISLIKLEMLFTFGLSQFLFK